MNTSCAMVPEFVKGIQQENVSATLKHFPGLGDTYTDPHYDMAAADATLETLREKELLPFKAGINAGADFVINKLYDAFDVIKKLKK